MRILHLTDLRSDRGGDRGPVGGVGRIGAFANGIGEKGWCHGELCEMWAVGAAAHIG